MMRPLWIGVLLSSVVLVSVDAQTLNLGPKPACFDDLDVLQEYVEAKNPLETEDFILCPNTVFYIGNPRSDASCCENGSAPLQLGPNTHYKCGADGTSTNNCTLTGGLFQVLATAPGRDQEEIITNSVVEGVTFRGGGGAGTLMVSNNNVTFRDCIFTEHGQHGAVNLLYMAAGTRRLLEIERREEKSKQLGRFLSYFSDLLERPEELFAWQNQHRVLQTDHTRQRLTLDSCVFKNNTYGESNQTNGGIVRAGTNYNDLIVKNCVFENNAFGDTERVDTSYAIAVSAGSTIELTDTCFIENDFVGSGTVNVDREEDIVVLQRNTGTDDMDIACPFVSIAYNETTAKCIDYDTNQCTPRPAFVRPTDAVAPVALNQRIETNVDEAVDIPPFWGSEHAIITEFPRNGLIGVNGGTIKYRPNQGFVGLDVIAVIYCNHASICYPEAIIVLDVIPDPNTIDEEPDDDAEPNDNSDSYSGSKGSSTKPVTWSLYGLTGLTIILVAVALILWRRRGTDDVNDDKNTNIAICQASTDQESTPPGSIVALGGVARRPRDPYLPSNKDQCQTVILPDRQPLESAVVSGGQRPSPLPESGLSHVLQPAPMAQSVLLSGHGNRPMSVSESAGLSDGPRPSPLHESGLSPQIRSAPVAKSVLLSDGIRPISFSESAVLSGGPQPRPLPESGLSPQLRPVAGVESVALPGSTGNSILEDLP